MRVLFVVTSFWAYGELLIAIEFAKRVRDSGHEPLFLIPPSHEHILQGYPFKYTVLIPGSRRINQILFQDIEHCCSPELVVMADFLNYHFCDRHYGLLPEDLTIFSGRIGTFDNFDWASTHAQLDTYGFRAKGFDTLTLDDYEFWLCPCPLNKPVASPDPRKMCYPLLGHLSWQNAAVKQLARETIAIPRTQKVILLTTATWQHTYKAYPRVQNFVKVCQQVVEHVLRRLDINTRIVSVGPSTLFQDDRPPNYHVYSQLPPAEFEKYILAADLYISNNIASTTLARVLLSGVPTLVLFSSLNQHDGTANRSAMTFTPTPFIQRALDAVEYCYPFRMFPVGWYAFLNPLVHKNPFCDALLQVELFDEEHFWQAIMDLLYNEALIEKLRGNVIAYRRHLQALPDVAQILSRLVSS